MLKKTFLFQSVLFQQVKYCGNTLPHRFLSVEGAVQIKFKSDGNGNGQGFKLEYSLPSKIFLIMYYFINLILIYEFIIILDWHNPISNLISNPNSNSNPILNPNSNPKIYFKIYFKMGGQCQSRKFFLYAAQMLLNTELQTFDESYLKP